MAIDSNPSAAQGAPATFEPVAGAKSLVVLVVDDLESFRKIAMARLRGLGVDSVLEAADGVQALQILRRESVDLVLSDWNMPAMDGLALHRLMREDARLRTLPFVMVTSETRRERLAELVAGGITNILTKPVTRDGLKARVEQVLGLTLTPTAAAPGQSVAAAAPVQASGQSAVAAAPVQASAIVPRAGSGASAVAPVRSSAATATVEQRLAGAQLRASVERLVRENLKGPLSGLADLLESLREDGDLERRQQMQIDLALQSARQMLELVELVPELYRIEVGRFTLAPQSVQLSDLLRQLAEVARQSFRSKRLTIVVDADVALGEEPPLALADPALCRALFQILLLRACDGAPDKGQVLIELVAGPTLQVLLTNPGRVAPELRENFFDRDAAQSTAAPYAAGLLAHAQGGQISLQVPDAEDVTTIIVTLPRVEAETGES